MGLIKKEQITDTGTRVIEREKRQSLAARKIPSQSALPTRPVSAADIKGAKNEAQKIIEQAVKEADSVRVLAREEGKQEGRAEAASLTKEALVTLNQAVVERKKILKDAEPEILRLALKVAEQIIRSEVSLHRDVCLNIVAEAIARVSDREQVIIRVNREDAEYLKKYKDRLAGIIDGVRSFSILEDQSIEPGGCIIETNLGFIDAKISTKLKSIEESLQNTYRQMAEEKETSSPHPPAPSSTVPPPKPQEKEEPDLLEDELFENDDLLLDDFDDNPSL